MYKQLLQVREFQQAFGQPVGTTPANLTPARATLRHSLLWEEVMELRAAMINGNLTETADGIVDCLYILYGTAIELGLDNILVEMFSEVHNSNMSKLGEDGKPVYREDGKVLKGPNYFKPNLADIISGKGKLQINIDAVPFSDWPELPNPTIVYAGK